MLESNTLLDNLSHEDNSMRRKYIIIIGLLFGISVILIILIMLFSNSENSLVNSDEPQIGELLTPTTIPLPSPSITLVPSYPPTPIPQLGDIIIDGIAVNNFKENPTRSLENGDLVIEENAEYQIIFNEPNQKFTLLLLGTNFEETRVRAENELMTILDLDEMNMCRLYIEEKFNDTTYPFSLCIHEAEM